MSTKRKKLLLINPLNTGTKGLIIHKQVIYPPLGLGIIATLTPDDWDVELLDENFDSFEFKDADLVALTALTSSVTRAYEIADIYRKKGIASVLGGIHASMMPGEAMKLVDSVVIGEVESVWPTLIEDFENGELRKSYTGKLLSMENAVKPRRDLFHKDYNFASIQTTRGCPMSCDFCSVHTFNGNSYRLRPVAEVLDELETLEHNLVYFVDDNLIGYGKRSQQRAIELFKGIIERGIKIEWFCSASMNFADNEEVLRLASASGCRMVLLGIESERIDQLQDMNKKLNVSMGIDSYEVVFNKIHKHGIAVLGAFIYGLQTDTPESMVARTEYINNASIDAVQATILTPLPGTGLFNRMTEEGKITMNDYPNNWQHYHFGKVVFKHDTMQYEVITSEIAKNWDKLYNEKILKKKFIRTLKQTKSPIAGIWSYGSNLQYYNLVFEHDESRPQLDLVDIFGLKEFESNPFL
ncbi:MAG: B12-binding domain-containing radical SAM protein [Bacteroidetes bacterium]|nr:B12-binding domain-containing radical SAM protein [Bacteroidota bacterium]MBL6943543.1 B12-binding domain-containing radical SAM protein [Bacteroidales bacterium]